MNIVKTGTKYRLFDKSVETGDKLPAIALEVGFSKFEGFYLIETDMPDLRGETVYGDAPSKVDKVFRSYSVDKSRNMGIILSGQKGIGKTLFAKMTAAEAIRRGVPVIYVNSYFSGLPGFFRNITQDCVVIFDEFDKNFISNSNDDRDETACQDEMLTMFDGIYGGHKLFVITCNEVDKLSDYYVNRPGRFRYHIRFGYPSAEEVRKYLTDKLGNHKDIDGIVRFSTLVPLSYDCLSAIVSELQMGETFRSAMSILNIVNIDEDATYNIKVTFEINGHDDSDMARWHEDINLFCDDGSENEPERFNFDFNGDASVNRRYTLGTVSFIPAIVRKYGKNTKGGGIEVTPEYFRFEPYPCDDIVESHQDEFKHLISTLKIKSVILMPSSEPTRISYEHVL